MTYEEFCDAQTDKAFKAVLTDNEFKRDFVRRLSDPTHNIRGWEEEIINRLMALSSSKIGLRLK